MARPKKNNVEYFPHTCIHGKKMSYIEKKHSNNGYATWFKILEELGNANNHYLNLSDEVQLMFLSDKCLVSEEVLINIINDLVRLKEFDAELWNDNQVIYCQKFIDSMEQAYSKRSNECINRESLIQLLVSLGVYKPMFTESKPQFTEQKVVINTQSKVKESKVKESKVKEFDLFWGLYDKKVGKEKTQTKFSKLKVCEVKKIMLVLPNYIKSTPEKKFRKDPLTYLNGKHWEDEIEIKKAYIHPSNKRPTF